MSFRRAAAGDEEALAKILHDAWHEAYRGMVPKAFLQSFTLARGVVRFRSSQAAGTEQTYLVGQEGKVLGFVTIGACRDSDLDRSSIGEIWGIYFDPRIWRQGIGGYLAAQALRLLRTQGYLAVTLWVLEANRPARLFYEAMGFRQDGGVKVVRFGTPMGAVRYRKSLACDAGAQR